jgi:transcriptional regulator with XRE-family HTH domain
MTGPALKQYRVRRNWTQRELSRHVGVDTNTIARWERGENRIPEPVVRLLAYLPTPRPTPRRTR